MVLRKKDWTKEPVIQKLFKETVQNHDEVRAHIEFAYLHYDEFYQYCLDLANGKREMTKAENELGLCNEILGIVSNLDDADEAREYARLYLKSQKAASKEAGEEYSFDESEVLRLVKETDSRF